MSSLKTIRIKVVFIGNDGVGKTSIAKRYIGLGFDVQYKSTIGADFYVMKDEYTFDRIGKYTFYWIIWDLAGQKYFNVVRPIYYNKARAAIVVFDVCRPETFRAVPQWIAEFWRYSGGKYPLILVGNKIDLREHYNCLPPDAGLRYSKQLTQALRMPIPYVETSAKTGHNIRAAFYILAKTIINFAYQRTRAGQQL